MPVLTNSPTLGDVLKYELNGNYTRETVTLKAGTDYALGAVLGRIAATAKYQLSPAAEALLAEREKTKKLTIQSRRLRHLGRAA